jgi:hypothetical protein
VTIASRRRIYWGLFGAACLCLAAACALGLPLFDGKADFKALKDSGAFQQVKVLGLGLDSARVSAAAIIAASLYATLCLAFILASFRKTVSSEIFFFAFWALSLGLEAGRLLVFSFAAAGMPMAWSVAAMRVVLGGRICGLLSFFAAGLHAAGFRNEKLGSAVAVIFVAGWALAYAMPVDTGVYEATLALRPGFRLLGFSLAAVAALATVANFLYASFRTGEKSYRMVSLGAGLALAGEALLLTLWHPAFLLAGLALLILGSWLVISRLHAYYLWQ